MLKSVAKQILTSVTKSPARIHFGLLRGSHFFVDPQEKALRLFGLDETEIASPLRALTREAVVAVDVGANDGWYSVFFASCNNIERVIAFEPAEFLWPRFDRNIAANGSRCFKVELVRRFVGSTDSEDTITLDSALRDERRAMIIKIDVEGAEVAVLRGARRVLASGRARLVIETHSPELERECLSLLSSFAFQASIVTPGWYRQLFPEYRPLSHNRWLVAVPGNSPCAA